tara:strand:+ start:224 stop:433 length:210 start_codon:yes stop_codon:yes gene_type:complete
MNYRMDNSVYFNNSMSIEEKISNLESRSDSITNVLKSNISDPLKESLKRELNILKNAVSCFKKQIEDKS